MASKKNPSKSAADKHERKTVNISLPGRPGQKAMTAGQAIDFTLQLAENNKWPAVTLLSRQLISQVPQLSRAWYLLFNSLQQSNDFIGLLQATEQYLKDKPRDVRALLSQASALRLLNQHDRALSIIEKVMKLAPANTNALNQHGIILKEMGNMSAALASFNRCLRLSPSNSFAYWNRSDLYNEIDDSELSKMEALLSKPSLNADSKVRLHYALSRGYEFRNNISKQCFHIEQGAKLKRSVVTYDHAKDMQEIKDIPSHFSAEVLNQAVTETSPETTISTPIFICGLPRSGTTLIEQIISSHSMVTAGDEINALPRAAAALLHEKGITKPFPFWAKDLQVNDWKKIGDNYQKFTQELHATPFFTDKNLQNYKALGLIHLARPDAKIIFCRRDPMDNLWGCYRQYFANGLNFTYDQEELADSYHGAAELYRYWQKVLPDKVFFLEYETLINHYDDTVKSLLEFIGLPWEENCLHFYNNPRPVKTTSTTQVRSPISTSRIGQWQKYQDHLQAMHQRLKVLGELE
ncbi:Uncharacterised protein [Zhongshania aliphaticivorans]|uniref:Beta-barrel assembly-enhancing protease n=1 Tax=Zhongshania aliphaticivorans TaxID=1470434 RepID=A0A5S9N7L3_9GAMM|nr:sulfotransferase [Zhongshania aliphaticivorans]CAA0079951.1 Uncharacterised protein [Zhongshania aliphaticivorans]CAA0085919.1 Uncharacterised protein [Zhongshania aliphaticivorans]